MHGSAAAENFSTIIFLHMPKCGGTTVHRILERQYPSDVIFTTDGARPSESTRQFAAMPQASRYDFRLIRGHMPFGVHRFARPPVTYCTILRDPVERMISLYHYVLREPSHHLHHDVSGSRMAFDDFVSSNLSEALSNAMTTKLTVDPFARVPVTGSPNESLERAKTVLNEHFTVVGLVERFDETLILMSKSFGWKRPYYARMNVTRNRPAGSEVSPNALAIIRERNTLDLALYEYVACRLQHEIERLGIPFARRLCWFKLQNRLWQGLSLALRLMRRGVQRFHFLNNSIQG
ncbi:sulfotransferase family 2 domain-containing protein [Chloroflexota bacterium]